MAIQHPAFADAFGARRNDILAGHFVEERVFGQNRQAGETADHQRSDRQHQMPEVVGDLAGQRQLREVFRHQPAHRKPVHARAAAEQHDEQHGKQERRHGVADDDRSAGPHVEMAAVAHGLANPQGDRHQIRDQGGPEPQRQRHGHLVCDELGNGGAAEKALAKIQHRVVPDHQPQALVGRFVEAVLALDIGYQFGVQAPAGSRALTRIATRAAHRRTAHALEASDGLFDRPAGCGLNNREVDDQDDQ